MFLRIGDGYSDLELFYLKELCLLLDVKVKKITDKIPQSLNAEAEGLLDYSEYFIGLGFCAMQRYLTDVLDTTGLCKGTVLSLGPKLENGKSVIEVINSLANWWKHESEWQHIAYEHEEIKKSNQQYRTTNSVLEVAEYPYVFSTALVEISPNNTLSLFSLISIFIDWRGCIDEFKKSSK